MDLVMRAAVHATGSRTAGKGCQASCLPGGPNHEGGDDGEGGTQADHNEPAEPLGKHGVTTCKHGCQGHNRIEVSRGWEGRSQAGSGRGRG